MIFTFRRILRKTNLHRKSHFIVLVATKVAIGFWESITVAWIAGFASWMVDIDNLRQNQIFVFVDKLFPGFLSEEPQALIIQGTLILLSLVVIRNVNRLLSIYLSGKFAVHLQTEFGHAIINEIYSRPYSWFLDKEASDLMQIFQWRFSIGGFLQKSLEMMTKLIVTVSLLATLIAYNWKVSLPVLLAMVIISFILFSIVRPALNRHSNELKDIYKTTFRETSSSIHGYKDIRILGAEHFIMNRLRRRFDEIIKHSIRRRLLSASPSPALEVLSFSILAITVLVLITRNNGNMGEIMSIMAMMAVVSWRIMPIVMTALGQLSELQSQIAIITHVLDFLDEDIPHRILSDRPPNETQYTPFSVLRVYDLGFSYSPRGPAIIDGVTFELHRGEKLGIIGSTSSGKTTLIDIMTGLLSQTTGLLTVNGLPLDGLKVVEWQSQIGYLPQNPYLFPGTVKENVAFGHPSHCRSEQRILEALAMSDLDIGDNEGMSLTDPLLANGKNLSGGKAQRITLARLIHSTKDIIFIDEGTSALDRETESNVIRNILGLDNEKTIVMATHRVDILSFCDRILWLEEGKVKMLDNPQTVIREFYGSIDPSDE